MTRVRYGVIGIKGIGAIHCRLAQEKAELTALVDLDAELVGAKSRELNVRGFTDYRRMLDAGAVDAVSIATPNHLHVPMALDCLHAGVHVFLEKPIAIRVSDADRVIELAAQKDLKLCVGHQYRTFRSSRVMKHLLEMDAIGDVLRVLWSWGSFRPLRYFQQDPWKSEWPAAGGGVLLHVSHDLNTLCWLIGRPVQVSALMGNQLDDTDVEDVACASILFENGALASIQGTINQPDGHTVRQIAGDKGIIVIQDVQSLTYDHGEEILLGTYATSLRSGKVQITDPRGQPGISWRTISLPRRRPIPRKAPEEARNMLMRLVSGERRPAPPHEEPLPYDLGPLLKRLETRGPRPHGLSVLMDSFLDAIVHGGRPLVDGTDALQTLELINAITLSAVRKKAVDLPLERDAYDALFEELSAGRTRIPKLRPSSGG